MKESKKELKGDLTEDQLRKMKKEVAESLTRDRHKLLVEQPFIGSVAMRFDLIPVRDKRCRTACTDFKSIYMDMAFYSDLTTDERVFVLAHEIWHNLQVHSMRKQTRDAQLWNIAADMEINSILADGSGGRALIPPKHLMFPPAKLKGKSAETLYDWLLKQSEKNNLNNALSKMGQPQESRWNDKDGDGDSDDDQDSKGKKGGKSGGKQQSSGEREKREKRDESKDGKNTGKLEGQFDRHEYEGQADDDSEQDGEDGKGKKGKPKGPSDKWGEVGYDEDFKPSVPQDAAERMREAAVSAAQAYQREHGELPAGIEGLVGKLAHPEVDWRDELAQFVTQHYGCSRKWTPPNRRHLHNDMYFQSRRDERIEGIVCLDTSGSCTSELPKFFGELKGLVDTFGGYRITVVQADAAVDKVDVYDDQENPLDLEYAEQIEWSGGGGTDYSCLFKYIEDEQLHPDFVAYIGDGYASLDLKQPPPYPVLWLITKDGTFDFCDWGKKIRFKESSWE